MMADPSVPHPVPFYSPISTYVSKKGDGPSLPVDPDSYRLQPVAYGMKFANNFAGATMLPVDFDPGTVNAVAYAGKASWGEIMVAILNRDGIKDLVVDLPSHVIRQVLTGPELESRQTQLAKGPGSMLVTNTPAGQRLVVPKHTALLMVLT